MSSRIALIGRGDARREFDALGVTRVRVMLLSEETGADWRREAQQWLDERLRQEGERAYTVVLTSIVLLTAAIAALVLVTWV